MVAIYMECQMIEHSIEGKHDQLLADLPLQPFSRFGRNGLVSPGADSQYHYKRGADEKIRKPLAGCFHGSTSFLRHAALCDSQLESLRLTRKLQSPFRNRTNPS